VAFLYRKWPSENLRTALVGDILLLPPGLRPFANWPFPVQSGSMELSTAIIQRRPMLRPYNQGGKGFSGQLVMLAESILIALVRNAFGVLMAIGGVRALVVLLPPYFPRTQAIHVDATVFGFTFAIAKPTGSSSA